MSPKRYAEFPLFFVDRVLLMILLWRTIFRNLKSPKLKYLDTHFLKKNSAHRFERSYMHKQAGTIFFFSKKNYLKDLEIFWRLQNHLLGPYFFHKKLISYFFLVWLFNFNIILKTYFKDLFWKTVKKWWFYYLK